MLLVFQPAVPARAGVSPGPNGFPLDLELDPDMNGWFEADVVINEATAAVQRFTKDAKLEPGSYVIVRDGRVKPPADAT